MELTTTRLVLRDMTASDAVKLHEYQVDARYLEHYDKTPDSAEIVRLAMSWAAAEPRLNYQLAVTLQVNNKIIGCVGLRMGRNSEREGEIGIELNPNYWGLGYGAEALGCIEELAISLGFVRLRAETKQSNERSKKLLISRGFQHEIVVETNVNLIKVLSS